MAVVWNAKNAAHLLRRATFSPTQAEIQAAVVAGQAATIAGLFVPPEPDVTDVTSMNNLLELQCWWLQRMLNTVSPLTEKLTLMWHNHFATGFGVVRDLGFMYQQNQVLRRNCLGNFNTLALETCQTAAMNIWLNGTANVNGSNNQNLARELMDCFTIGTLDSKGKPTYTQTDVAEAARALTGWTFDAITGAFVLNDLAHDNGTKNFRGLTGNLDGTAIIAQLTADPATARRVAWRLWNTFAYAVDISSPVLDPLQAAYISSNGQIQPVVTAMFSADAFYSAAAIMTHVKNPCEWLMGAIRQLTAVQVPVTTPAQQLNLTRYLSDTVTSMGQSLFDPPSVFGWDEGMDWLSSSGLYGRLGAADDMAYDVGLFAVTFTWVLTDLLPPAAQWPTVTPAALINWLATKLQMNLQASTKTQLLAYLGSDIMGTPSKFVLDNSTNTSARNTDGKVRGLIFLMMISPEYNFC